MKRLCIAVIFIQLLQSCKGEVEQGELQAAKGDYAAEKNIVDTMHLKSTAFSREIISNGNLRAARRADMVFKTNGTISKIYRNNGDRVKAGDTVALLDRGALKLKLDQARIDMEKAELDFTDNLLGFGYGKDTANIPDEIVRIAAIRSGYFAAKHNLESALIDFRNGAIVAPFGGVVANIEAKPYETVSESFCSVIDDSTFEVEFNLLESELNYLKSGQEIKIMPYIDINSEYRGKISRINPVVDENGQIKVVASISNRGGKLLEGMNVKIYIESTSSDKLVVPKSAVVIRDGFDVLFTFDKATNRAGWVYVDILESNSTSHVVIGNARKNAELEAGDCVIVSGNLNLAEGSRVEVKK